MVVKEIELGGKTLSVETGRYARQASGSVMVRYGDTMVLVTAVAAEKAKEDQDFFPLSVEYREKASAAGKFPGGFFKREGKPTEKEILSARLIDRPIRPLFPDGFLCETQVVAQVFSYDGENDSDVLGAVGASAALVLSDIPFNGPVGEVRVGRVNGEFIINPTHKQVAESDIELVVAGTADSIMMVEGDAREVSEDVMLDALKFAHEGIKKLVELQLALREATGKPKREVSAKQFDPEVVAAVNELALAKYTELVATVLGKEDRAARNKELNETVQAALVERFPGQEKAIGTILHDMEKELMRNRILEAGLRLDGRNTTQIRPISIHLGVLPRAHGSALFTRGETQALASLTLGTKNDEQIIDGLMEEYTKKFILHYSFPPFSVGEVGRMTGVGRREVGHGNLAERSLKNMVSMDSDFPYAIRITSDILESNGSSSMASVCSGSLAMMDGGVPLRKPVAGIAMGLVKEGSRYAVLSDILGNEDHLGDMDFKVAGTADGITGFQMDIKIEGISFEIMEKALRQAKDGRMHILGIMNQAIEAPRKEMSLYAPRLISFTVPQEMIGALIGPGGKTIQKMERTFNVEIVIEDGGMVNIASPNLDSVTKCQEYIAQIIAVPEIGKVYTGTVTRLMEFGAIIEFLPGKTGLMHISEMDTKRVAKVSDVCKEGDTVTVKLLKIDNGKFSLSRREVLRAESGDTSEERPRSQHRSDRGDRHERSDRGDRGDRRGGHHHRKHDAPETDAPAPSEEGPAPEAE